MFGVAGQLTKDIVLNEFLNYWPLFFAVLIGGQIGSFLNIKFLSNKILAFMTSFLVIFVAIKITNNDVNKASILLDRNFIFKKLPICPPIKTATNKGQ